ncbi:MAG: radical SAM protein [candidate division NC10 bacterium]|nr:radical SAM protein [candidate division NC10 bacterium]
MAVIHNREHRLRLVFWETTAGCNLECKHCRRLDVAREMMRDDLSTGEALALVDAIAGLGGPILVLSGGEPLLRPDIYAIARHAAGRGLTVSLATNGTLVDREVARQIRATGILRCAVSLDGATAATHDVFRRQLGAFHRALEGIAALRAAGCEIQINTTVARHNEHELRAIYDLAVGIGAVALHYFMLVPVGCGLALREDQMLSAPRYEEVLHDVYDLATEGRLHIKATCAPHYYRVIRQRAKGDGRPLHLATDGMAAMTKGCLAGSAVCFVSHKGEVFPCGYLPVEAGHVRRQAFADIWKHSPVFARLRDPDLLGGKCGPCEFKTVCAGCRARAYADTGDYLAEEPFCAYQPRRR